uniref:Zn(2)-C6 fungal-type domain-containing protein n=1 Tax=Ganoderma boninense TaxID=34458 RepID=A0A5K1JZ84_9APHY|nr:Zn(2)-C6 fungal-type domain-containing protein [Ganoderma boninense]
MTQSHSVLFATRATITVWGQVPDQQYTYVKAMTGVVRACATSQLFLCATDNTSTIAAPVESFTQFVKLNGPAITMCNEHGGVCVLFKDENTLRDFAKSVADVAPVIGQVLDPEEDGIATERSDSPYMSDSLLSKLSDSFLDNFSDIEADEERGLGWEFIDN